VNSTSNGEASVRARRLPALAPSVLILDDEEDALERRARLLKREYGLRVAAASSSEAAMHYVTSVRGLDLIIADVNLGGAGSNDLSGADFAADAYEFDPSIPIIIYSGIFSAAEELSERHRYVGRFLRKVAKTSELEQELEAAYGEASKHREALANRSEKILIHLREGLPMPLRDIITLKQSIPGAMADTTRDHELVSLGYDVAVRDFEDLPSMVYWWRQDPTDSSRVQVELFGHEYIQMSADSRVQAVDRIIKVLDLFAKSYDDESRGLAMASSQRLLEYVAAYKIE
jgi:CheY-like chemotaxis protein